MQSIFGTPLALHCDNFISVFKLWKACQALKKSSGDANITLLVSWETDLTGAVITKFQDTHPDAATHLDINIYIVSTLCYTLSLTAIE